MTNDKQWFLLKRDWDVSSKSQGVERLKGYMAQQKETRLLYATLHRLLREAGAKVDLPPEI